MKAFRKGFSTELLLTQLTELWRQEVDKGKAVAVAFIDFKKAFDCVQLGQLLTKLQRNFGILGPLHNWLKAALVIVFSILSLMAVNLKCNQFQSESRRARSQGQRYSHCILTIYHLRSLQVEPICLWTI